MVSKKNEKESERRWSRSYLPTVSDKTNLNEFRCKAVSSLNPSDHQIPVPCSDVL